MLPNSYILTDRDITAAYELRNRWLIEHQGLLPAEKELILLAQVAKDLRSRNHAPTVGEIRAEMAQRDYVLTIRGGAADALAAAEKVGLEIEIVITTPANMTLAILRFGWTQHVQKGTAYAWWGATSGSGKPGALEGYETVRQAIKRAPEIADLLGVAA